ncbi:MAG: hypothetical protein J6C59_09600 [Muribaculaceae bacterium]|nr:hypothetical protein [Muribaculaceae bacterium]
MTQLEMRAMSAIIALNRKVKNSHKIDWEQRRYEIAKEVMASEASKGSFSAGYRAIRGSLRRRINQRTERRTQWLSSSK